LRNSGSYVPKRKRLSKTRGKPVHNTVAYAIDATTQTYVLASLR